MFDTLLPFQRGSMLPFQRGSQRTLYRPLAIARTESESQLYMVKMLSAFLMQQR